MKTAKLSREDDAENCAGARANTPRSTRGAQEGHRRGTGGAQANTQKSTNDTVGPLTVGQWTMGALPRGHMHGTRTCECQNAWDLSMAWQWGIPGHQSGCSP